MPVTNVLKCTISTAYINPSLGLICNYSNVVHSLDLLGALAFNCYYKSCHPSHLLVMFSFYCYSLVKREELFVF